MENRIRRFHTEDQVIKPGPGSSGIWVNADGELSYSASIDGEDEVFTVNTLEGDPIEIDGGAIEDIAISGEVDLDMSDAASVLVIPQADVPAQTAEGSVVWDSDSDLLTIGDGASRKVMVDTTSTQALAGKTLTTPVLGVATATSINKVAFTAPATGATLTLIEGTTVTGPSATGTLATLAGVEALTNKVLTTPTFTKLSEVVTSTNVISAAESGSTFYLNSATEFVSTLPAPALGLNFKFYVSAAPSGASYTIVSTDGTDNIHGVGVSSADAAGSVDSTAGTAADTITFVDGQALKGDCVFVESDGTSWYAVAFCSDEDAITFSAT